MKKLGIIHVGLPKTATTTFQKAVYEHRHRLLSDYRILYPSIAENHTDALHAMFSGDTASLIQLKGLGSADEVGTVRERMKAAFEASIEEAGTEWDTLVLSAEGLSNLHARELSALKEWTSQYVSQWKILFWTRHPINYTSSNIQQMIRGGHTINELTLQLPIPYFRERLSSNIKIFGRDAIEIKAFENAITEEGGVVAAFCRQIGLSDQVAMEIAATATRENDSMSLLATHLIDSLNRQRPLFIDGCLNPERSLEDANVLALIPGKKFALPPSVKNAIKLATRADVAWLNENFGLSLYTDTFEDRVLKPENLNNISPTSVDAIGIIIADLLRRVDISEKNTLYIYHKMQEQAKIIEDQLEKKKNTSIDCACDVEATPDSEPALAPLTSSPS